SHFQSRGSTRDGTGVHDSIVNQLLTKIDGVESLNNVLLIGMTNRKDLLDEALLRPGRLEVQVEISLPDENGRLQILQIHTNKMKENSFLAPDVNLQELAARTKNYSGAELEGVVKSAVSFALNRQLSMDDLTKPVDEESIKVEGLMCHNNGRRGAKLHLLPLSSQMRNIWDPGKIFRHGMVIPPPTQPHGFRLLTKGYHYATDGLLIRLQLRKRSGHVEYYRQDTIIWLRSLQTVLSPQPILV
ncbi:hypothetical protein SLEP1_g59101, partial [Rubroshorea leprosula]